MNTYQLIDCGDGERLETFGPYTLARPCAQALWPVREPWQPHARFVRQGQAGAWKGKLPESWEVVIEGLTFIVKPTDFGHLGLFPEHHIHWPFLATLTAPGRVLNLFAYTGSSSLFLAALGFQVTHLDASLPAIAWAKENAARNRENTIRWIVDDAMKFLKREERRGTRYDFILLDPPTFGRGAKGEIFKIHREINALLTLCRALLSEAAQGLLLTTHTPELTPRVLQTLLQAHFPRGNIACGEHVLRARTGLLLPLGAYARWTP